MKCSVGDLEGKSGYSVSSPLPRPRGVSDLPCECHLRLEIDSLHKSLCSVEVFPSLIEKPEILCFPVLFLRKGLSA